MTGFGAAHLCTACDLAPKTPPRLCDYVNGVVSVAFHNLTARGVGTEQAARSALVVLKIHQPDLCPCNSDRVRDWLLTNAANPQFS